MSRTTSILLYTAVAFVAALIGLLVANLTTGSRQVQNALVLPQPRAVAEFSLIDHDGQPFVRDDFAGRWTLVFFGFTNCPDVCPTTLQTLAMVSAELTDMPPELQPAVIMVSVDPGRDTVETMATYVPYFDPGFTGVTGEIEQIDALARSIGVAHAITQESDDGSYGVEHTASVFLMGPDAALAAVFSSPHMAQGIADDYRIIVGASR